MNGESKITSVHWARTALVYIRQSTLVQVRDNVESTARQYDLARRAIELGWAPADVVSGGEQGAAVQYLRASPGLPRDRDRVTCALASAPPTS